MVECDLYRAIMDRHYFLLGEKNIKKLRNVKILIIGVVG